MEGGGTIESIEVLEFGIFGISPLGGWGQVAGDDSEG